MNINFHYFLVKTLAIEAGLDESTAQFLALTSEMVDDMTPDLFQGKRVESGNGQILKILVEQRPSAYFQERMMVFPGRVDGCYEFLPSVTSFTYTGALKDATQFESVIPFHFYVDHYVPNPVDRSVLRTKPAVKGTDLYISMDALVDQILEYQRKNNSGQRDKELLRFGMLLHVFADTFAHAGFSGGHGWENRVELLKVFGPTYEERGKTFLERVVGMGKSHTSYGHGQLAHLPDVCCMSYQYRCMEAEGDGFSKEILRCNKEVYEMCAGIIFEWFMRLSGREDETALRWEAIKDDIMRTACMVSEEEDNLESADRIAGIWADNYFHDPNMVACLRYRMDELFGQSVTREEDGQPVYRFTNPELFYLFNEVTYDFRNYVMGKY